MKSNNLRKYSIDLSSSPSTFTHTSNYPKHRRLSYDNYSFLGKNIDPYTSKTIYSIKEKITQTHPEQKLSLGSLYKLFSSEIFSLSLLIYYLDSVEQIGIGDTGLNLLYGDKFKKEAYFYLPQLIGILLNKKDCFDPLKRFLLNCSLENISFGLKMYFVINSFLSKVSKSNSKKLKAFLKEFEHQRLIRKRTAMSDLDFTLSPTQKLENKYGMIYYDKVFSFFNSIADLFNTMKTKIKEEKDKIKQAKKESKSEIISDLNSNVKEQFNIVINKLNTKIKNGYKISNEIKRTSLSTSIKLKNIFRGIILPLINNSKETNQNVSFNISSNYDSIILVNISAQHSLMEFNPKDNNQINIKLVFECIRISDCDKWEELYGEPRYGANISEGKNNSLSYTNVDEYVNQDGTVSIINTKTGVVKNISDLKDEAHMQYDPFSNSFNNINNNIIRDIKISSSFRNFPTYSGKQYVMKYNKNKDRSKDYLSEYIGMQLFNLGNINIISDTELPLKLHPYDIVMLSQECTLVEQIPNYYQIEEIRNKLKDEFKSFNGFYRNYFCNNFEEAQKNFVESLSSYCLFYYMVNSKLNILENSCLDSTGKVGLESFGVAMLSNGSGNAPVFKLPKDFLEIMDGIESGMFQYFQSLIIRGIITGRKNYENFEKNIDVIIKNVEIEKFAVSDRKSLLKNMKDRFHLGLAENELAEVIGKIVLKANSK